jgi:hypothetical protein
MFDAVLVKRQTQHGALGMMINQTLNAYYVK